MLMIQVFPFASNSISTINNIVNEDLELLKTWVEEKKLSFNVAKIHCILIGSRNKLRAINHSSTTMSSIHIGDDKVSPITSIKYVRAQVDKYLNWEEHLLTIAIKVSRVIAMLRLAKRYIILESAQMMYRS